MNVIDLGGDGNTLELMEYLRKNPVDDYALDFHVFHNDRFRFIVSRLPQDLEEGIMEDYPLSQWFEYEGMYRIYVFSVLDWVFLIDGRYYYAT